MPIPLKNRKHTLMLCGLILGLLLQPLIHGFAEVVSYAAMLVVFLVVFEQRWARDIGLTIGLAAVSANAAAYFIPAEQRLPWLLAFHGLMIAFLGFALFALLRDIFSNERIEFDHVLGAFSGFVLAGMLWGNAYLMIHLVSPDSFLVQPHAAADLRNEGLRRFLFNHLSFMTLMSNSTSDISPTSPAVRTLIWLESLFGQFYFAVFIGQLIALRQRPGV